MKSLNEINIDFKQSMSQAAELEEAARNLRQMADREFADVLQEISGAWQGDMASAYIRKGHLLKERMCKNADDLDKVAQTIRNAAQRYYNAEMQIYRIAHQREY